MPVRLPTLVIAAYAFLASAALAAPQAQAPKPKPAKPPAAKQAPVVKQNFRGRRSDEIYPWEGFEDCPMVMPCVGRMRNTRQ